MVVAKDWEKEGGVSYYFMGIEIWFCKMKRVMESYVSTL
jgi:hypothetical protein